MMPYCRGEEFLVMQTRVAVLFGGQSVEHEVSIISGLQAFAALDRSRYVPIPLYITKDNRFYTGPHMGDVASYRDMPACLATATRVLPVPAEKGRVELVRYPFKKFGNNVVDSFDVALPVVHGTNTEDGTLMGFLEMLGVPYASCDVTSSALGMDKYKMKAVLRQAGLPVLDALLFSGREVAADTAAAVSRIESAFPYPVIVKPVNLGSSVGISKAGDRDALGRALDLALSFSAEVLIERAVVPLRELNCAVLGDRDTARASVCEEPSGCDEILSYQDKYLRGGKQAGAKSGGMASLGRRCPADIPEELAARVQEPRGAGPFRRWAVRAVPGSISSIIPIPASCSSMRSTPSPGSLAFYLWEAAGTPFTALLDEMIALAFKRAREREALTFSVDSNLLASVRLGGAKGGKIG